MAPEVATSLVLSLAVLKECGVVGAMVVVALAPWFAVLGFLGYLVMKFMPRKKAAA